MMTHTFLLIFCCLETCSREKALFCENSNLAIFCTVLNMERNELILRIFRDVTKIGLA